MVGAYFEVKRVRGRFGVVVVSDAPHHMGFGRKRNIKIF
jgi:hypothetical protein